MFASPIKKITANRRLLTVQNMSREEYALINNVPSTMNDKRSAPVENDNGFTPITREEMGFGGGLPKKIEPSPAPALQRNLRVEENLSHRSSRASILEKFNKTIETPQPEKRSMTLLTTDNEPRFTNYGILDNFKNRAAQPEHRESISESVVEAKTPSRRDVLLSPRKDPLILERSVERRLEPQSQDSKKEGQLLMAHFLLGCEITRLMDVIKQYEQNLVSLNKDLDDSLAEGDDLREEIQQLKRDMQKVVDEDGRFKNSLMNLQKNNNELSSRLDEEIKKNILLNHQLTALANTNQPKQVKEEQSPGTLNFGLMDFMNDDKNSLVQQLVRRNLENDKLRREIEFLKMRIPPVNTTTSLQVKTDSERTKELLRCIGNSFFNNQDKGNPMIYDLELIKIKADGLVGKVDDRDRMAEGSIKDRTNTLVHSIKSLHMEDEGIPSYEKDRDGLFKNIEELIKKLCSPKIGTVMNSVSNQGFSPGKPNSQHFGTTEEFRTEIVNGVPVKVKVIRRDPRSEQPAMNNENVNTLNTKQDISAREAQGLKVELGRALKRISELENQNQLLLSKIDKYVQGNKQLVELGGDQPSYRDAPTSNVIAIEELRAQIFGLKNEIHDLKLRMEQGRLDRERMQQENDELQERLGYHAREVNNLKKREQECNNQLIQANNEKNHMAINLRAAELEVGKLRTTVPVLEEKLEKAESELRSVEKSLNAKLNESSRKVDEKEVLLESLKRNLSEKQSYIAGLERKQDNLEELCDELKNERDGLASKLNKSVQECEDLREKMKEQGKEIKRLNEELNEMDAAMHLMKSKIMDLQSQKEGHLKTIEEMKKNEQDLIEELVECKSQISKLKSTVEQKDASIVEANRSNSILNLKQQKTLDLVHQLKKSVEKIRLAFETELLDVKKRLHKGKEDQDKYINSLSALLQTQAELNPRGTLTSLRQSRAKLAEIPKLMTKIGHLDGTARQKQEELLKLGEDLRKDIQQLERNLEVAEDKIRQLQKELVQKDNAIDLVTESSKRYENMIPRLKIEVEDGHRQCDKLNDEVKRLKTTTDFLNANIDNLTQENRLLRTKVEKKDRQIEDLEDEMENQKKKIDTVTKQLKNFEETNRTKENPFHNSTSPIPQFDFFIDKSGYKLNMELPKTTEKKLRPQNGPEINEPSDRGTISEFEIKEKDLRRQLSEKESELEEVKSKLEGTKSRHIGGDQVEQLKEKIDVLLSKIESVQRTKLDLKQFNELAEIKKKYAEVNKKCIKEYIGVCQQSLDLYERITGRYNK